MRTPSPSDAIRDKRFLGLLKRPLFAAAVSFAVGLAVAYAAWSVLRSGDPRYIRLDYDGLAGRYATRFLPIQHRPYAAFDAGLFDGDEADGRYGFGFARPVEDRWRVVAVGDVMAHDSLQISAFTRRNRAGETAGGYDWLLADAKGLIEDAGLAIGNIETVVSDRFPRQGFPAFNADPRYLKALAALGFDAMTTANNHILDFGAQGLRDTEKNLAAHGLAFVGTGGAPPPGLLIEVPARTGGEPLTVGILSYTDYVNGSAMDHIRGHGELTEVDYLCVNKHWAFSTFVDRLAPETCHTGEDSFLREVGGRISALRKAGADYVAVFLHRLRAYEFSPSEQERRQAAELAKLGADAIVNTGSHSIMPVDRIHTRDGEVLSEPGEASREHLVAYGLGNFVSTQGGAAAYGLAARIDIARDRDGRFVHAVTPFFAKSFLTMEEYRSGDSVRKLEIYRLRMLDLDAFLAEVRQSGARRSGARPSPATGPIAVPLRSP